MWSYREEQGEKKQSSAVTWTSYSQSRYGSLRLGCCQERKHMAGRLVEVPAGYSLGWTRDYLEEEGEEGGGGEK